MAESIDFAVRDQTGGVSRGMAGGEGASDFIQVGQGDAVSLNLRKASILKYERAGDDLQVVLADGRVLTLSNYFDAQPGANSLYISADGEITQVYLEDTGEGVLFADYASPEIIGKWSPNDDLAFLDGEDILAPADDGATGMAAFAPLLGLGPLGAAAGLLGAAAVAGGGGGDGDDGTTPTDPGGDGDTTDQNTPITPTVDNADSDTTLTTNTPADDQVVPVSGTGEPGSTVVVTVGDQTQETTIDDDGLWDVVFEGDDLPADGDYSSEVVVTAPDGTEYELDGPDFLIDMTPPPLEVTEGAGSTGDVENLEEYADGITISGESEAGATVTVEIDGQTQSAVVDADGNWTVTFTEDQLPGGEYTEAMVITATDVNGNETILNDTLVVDTVPHAVTFDTVASDDIINAAEQSAAAGVAVSGTSTPGAVLQVEFAANGATHEVTVDADGNWSTTFAADEIPTGTYDTAINVTTTDAAGNVTNASHAIAVDTDFNTVTFDTVAADDVINAAEQSAASGVTVGGTATAGAVLQVVFAENGATHEVTVDADGNWSTTFAADEIPTGTYDTAIDVTTTDAAGNVTTASHAISVDTDPNTVTFDTVAGDDIVNAAEQSAAVGVTVSGTSTPGAVLQVEFDANGATHEVTVAADGTWSTVFEASEIPAGTYDTAINVTTTDAAGNVTNASHDVAVDTQIGVTVSSANVTANDNVVNAAEFDGAGFSLTGTTDAGNAVSVTIGGVTVPATVLSGGAWTVNLTSGDLAAAGLTTGTYEAVVTATDAAGNEMSTSRDVVFDLETAVAFGDTQAGDNLITSADTGASTGLTLTGMSEPGNSVTVTLGTGTATVVAGATGSWSAVIAASDLPTGTGTATATVTATDAAGNTATDTHELDVDTEVQNLGFTTATPNALVADDIVNAAEGAGGLVVTGTVEAGSQSVVLQLGNGSVITVPAANIDAAGNWSATIPAGDLPNVESSETLVVTATDGVGNVLTAAPMTIAFDPLVMNFAVTSDMTADNVVNAKEAAAGFTLTGTVEAGSVVMVTLGSGAAQQATVNADGTWSIDFDRADLVAGGASAATGTMTYTVEAVDAAGNVAVLDSADNSFAYDFEAPAAADFSDVLIGSTTYSGVLMGSTAEAGTYDLSAVRADGTVVDLAETSAGSFYQFAPQATSTYLVATDVDAAGNESSTLMVADTNSNVTVDLGRDGLEGFDFAKIDLDLAEANLTISADQIQELTGPDHTLIIQGDANDSVTVTTDGFTETGTTQIDGEDYTIYTLGDDDATLIIDDSITNLTI
ncbi:hypothetical protein BFP70_15310 [Thioclava sp. SK-1]|uniref:Ig-like domain-containing protein n=1 Tax=Thioclava sp. SK-1 TaxID=1889770 RepID=UPI00082667D8|nr:Ig-like domain-containing protein [Thioclava sp. SK-1]OCX61674.1 hypothetical protein BFP70_15310 [Thioclava sp. SK-1]